MPSLLLLAVAIVIEVIGSAALKASRGFSEPLPSVVVVVSAIATFYLIGIIVNRLPLGIIYATWSGVGTALTAVIGVVVFRETLVLWQIAGIGLIIAGVILLNVPPKPRTDPQQRLQRDRSRW
jgi:multidrug transporter EmrE-like cation transporter